MKKFLAALIISVLTLTSYSVLIAHAEEETEQDDSWVDAHPWIKDYEEDEKWVYFIQGSRTDEHNRGYYGVDVIMGDWVVLIPTGNVRLPNAEGAPSAAKFSSLVQLFYNNTDEDWILPNTLSEVGGADGVIHADANGQVYRIDNSRYIFDIVTEDETEPYWDLIWDPTTEEAKIVKTAEKDKHKTELEPVHLKYGMLGTEYLWLDKETVEKNKAEGVVFTDESELYYNAETKKYSDTEGEGYKKVMNDENGYVIPAGGYMLVFKFLDRSVEELTQEWAKFHKLVNGEDDNFKVVFNDKFAPEFRNIPSETVRLKSGEELIFPNVEAFDVQPLGQDIDLSDQIVRKIYKFNTETQAYDIEVEDVADMDLEFVSNRYKIEYTVKDEKDNEAVGFYIIEVIGDLAPVFVDGITNISIDQGQSIDLTKDIVVDDGYGNPIDIETVQIITDLNVDKPGTYTVTYVAINSFNLTTIATRKITVVDKEAPVVVKVLPVTIVKGDEFNVNDVMDYVVAIDNGTETSNLSMYIANRDEINLNNVGTHDVVVAVEDGNGNKTEVTVKVTVLEQSYQTQIKTLADELKSKSTLNLVLAIVATTIGVAGVGIGVFSVLNKKKAS